MKNCLSSGRLSLQGFGELATRGWSAQRNAGVGARFRGIRRGREGTEGKGKVVSECVQRLKAYMQPMSGGGGEVPLGDKVPPEFCSTYCSPINPAILALSFEGED